jgi:cell division protein FtsB
MESVLIGVAVLACPVGMGLMMWFMAKGMRGEGGKEQQQQSAGEIEQLRSEQARLAAEVDRLERERARDGEPVAPG